MVISEIIANKLSKCQKMKTADFVISTDHNEVAHNQLSDLGLHSLHSSLLILKMIYRKTFFLNLAVTFASRINSVAVYLYHSQMYGFLPPNNI